jgi:hypothetical protein
MEEDECIMISSLSGLPRTSSLLDLERQYIQLPGQSKTSTLHLLLSLIQTLGIHSLWYHISQILPLDILPPQHMHKGTPNNRSHNGTAPKLLKQLRQPLLSHLLNLIVAALLLLAMMLLLSTTILLSTSMLTLAAMMLAAVLLLLPSAMLPWISSTTPIAGCLRWRRHIVHSAALQIDKNASLILLRAVLQP